MALLLGVTIGVQRAEEIGAFLGRPAPVLLEVKVQEASGSVQVRWNVDGPAVTQAASGVLYLEAEGRAWTEPLNAAQVARGEAIFQGLPRSLQGRLDLELHDGARLSRPFRLGR